MWDASRASCRDDERWRPDSCHAHALRRQRLQVPAGLRRTYIEACCDLARADAALDVCRKATEQRARLEQERSARLAGLDSALCLGCAPQRGCGIEHGPHVPAVALEPRRPVCSSAVGRDNGEGLRLGRQLEEALRQLWRWYVVCASQAASLKGLAVAQIQYQRRSVRAVRS